jgi:hypothetical protein
LNNNQQNIDRIIKEKFENFSPQPPGFIWDNIEANLNEKPAVFGTAKVRNIIIFAVSAIVIILLGWLLLGNKYFSHKNDLTNGVVSVESPAISGNSTNITAEGTNGIETEEPNENNKPEIAKTVSYRENVDEKTLVSDEKRPEQSNFENSGNTSENSNSGKRQFNYTASKGFEFKVPTNTNNGNFVPTLGALLYSGKKISICETPRLLMPAANASNGSSKSRGNAISKWKAGVFISPEFALTTLDSLEVLHSYTLGVDMQYSLSKNTFLRFGLGTTYSRDRGFTAIEFKRWDYIGSYNDVYEVTFDTSSGVPVPTYHTHKVDVYDSIQHFDVSETTNRYLYMQFPVMLGYNIETKGRFNWYVYGGPVINALVYKEKSTPELDKNSTFLNYNTDLYERDNLIYQFRLGMGFEFDLTSKFSFTFEPDYIYYFNPVFKNYYEKQPLSTLSLRLGFFIKL